MPSLVLKPTHKPVNNPDFARRNIIATELEKIIDALASPNQRYGCD